MFDGDYYGALMHYCTVGNLNGDEFEDLVVSSTNFFNTTNATFQSDILNVEKLPRTHLFINNGDGSYSAGNGLFQGVGHHRILSYGSPFVADLNNDGIDDILSQYGGGGDKPELDHGIAILMSQPDGSFADATSLIELPTYLVERDDYSESVIQLITESLVALDVDGDGWRDLVIVGGDLPDGAKPPLILFNDQAQLFTANKDWAPSVSESTFRRDAAIIRHAEVVDFDLDGDEDVVAMCYRECFAGNPEIGNGFVLINNDGAFTDDGIVYFPEGLKLANTKNDHMDVGDINGDSYPDIVVVGGEVDPYYVDRDIQILVNQNGTSLSDETGSRITNIRNQTTGHAEGAIYLRDYDLDGDLDIIDFQDNVRQGLVYDSLVSETPFPFGWNGLAIYLNDGSGNFTYTQENIINSANILEVSDSVTVGQYLQRELTSPIKACPIFFNRQYGYGFLFSHGWGELDPSICPNNECWPVNFSTVRKNL